MIEIVVKMREMNPEEMAAAGRPGMTGIEFQVLRKCTSPTAAEAGMSAVVEQFISIGQEVHTKHLAGGEIKDCEKARGPAARVMASGRG